MNEPGCLRGLYGITDASLCPDDDSLVNAVEAALRGGLRILQYRDKTLAFEAQLRQARTLRQLCQQYGALFIINDSLELARQSEAGGVHLGRDDCSVAQARAQLGKDIIVGRSCYDRLELALEAQRQGADYIAFGRFFPSKTKPGAVQAPAALIGEAHRQLSIPVCAIGGITPVNAAPLLEQGADMLAVINDLFGATDIEARAREFGSFFV